MNEIIDLGVKVYRAWKVLNPEGTQDQFSEMLLEEIRRAI